MTPLVARSNETVRMSSYLSERTIQPGTDNTGIPSENDLCQCLRKILLQDEWVVTEQPDDLLHIFGRYGLRPDAKIENTRTHKVLYLEVKYQGPRGNAEERAGKLFTHHFVEWCKTVTRMPYHAYAIIFTGNLATDRRYVEKFKFFYDEDEYLCWDGNANTLETFIRHIIEQDAMDALEDTDDNAT